MMTEYLRNRFLNHFFRDVPLTTPKCMHVGLLTSTGEINTPDYKRVEIPANSFGFDIDENISQVTNKNSYDFPFAVVDWATPQNPITRWALFDAPVGGNMLIEALFETPFTVEANTPKVVIMAGDLTVKLGDL